MTRILPGDVPGWIVLAAAMFAAGVILTAVLRGRRLSYIPLSREKALENRVSELENTVKTMQSLLVQKENENNRLRVEVAELRAEVKELRRATHETPQEEPAQPDRRSVILACVSESTSADLNALRAVQARTGLRFTRLYPVTLAALERKLTNERRNGTPVRFVHFGVRSGPEGLLFSDGVATGGWLEGVLKGTELVVIAGCKSDIVGDLLRSVPHVVTLREEVSDRDAAVFTEVFWQGIGEGLDARQAFNRALDRCPPEVAEFAEFHG